MKKLAWLVPLAFVSGGLVLGVLAPLHAGAIESSVTIRREHPRCDSDLWRHLEGSAMDGAAVFCAARGGVDEGSLRYVHDESRHGAGRICVLHLHFGCRGELPDDASRT